MLSKVANFRVKRRSVQQLSPTVDLPHQREVVDRAPDLHRWCDIGNPFPSVSFGGYSSYYKSQTISDADPSRPPIYCPLLSEYPEASSSTGPPPAKAPLFITRVPVPKRFLSIIHEASTESMTPRKKRRLPVTSLDTSPKSLRRQKGRILRTPSIERDFAVHARQLFALDMVVRRDSTGSSTTMSTETEPDLSLSHDRASSQSPSSSDDSHSHSHSSQADLDLNYPATPATSVGSDWGHELLAIFADEGPGYGMSADGKEIQRADILDNTTPKRPDSRSSFSTAKSSLSERNCD